MEQWTTAMVYPMMLSQFNEKQQRLYAASEALRLGFGGISKVSRETGISRVTITAGIKQLGKGIVQDGRIRSVGAGRKLLSYTQADIVDKTVSTADPKGNPENPIRWTSYSMEHIASVLRKKGYTISSMSVYRILKTNGFALKANKKTIEVHIDRNAQFMHMNERAKEAIKTGSPVVSIDCKKKELIGNFKNNGREWLPKGKSVAVNVYDFLSLADGKIAPYGIYDLVHNSGFVNVGIDHDTAAFSVESIRRWWKNFGKQEYPKAKSIMITADGGGSNGSKNRLFKVELQKLANEIRLPIQVSHYPPYTSKWNAIEHKLFSFISINWRAKPLISLEVVIELLNHTTTKSGLKVTAMIDKNIYKTGIKVPDKELEQVNIQKDDFHPEWNYTIIPRPTV
jgi:transposase